MGNLILRFVKIVFVSRVFKQKQGKIRISLQTKTMSFNYTYTVHIEQ